MGLFTAFDKVSHEDWRKKIEVDLKGKNFEDTLVWKSEQGIDVQPFYNSSNLPTNNTPLKVNNNWSIRENVFITTYDKANKKALLALKGGADSICFIGEISSKDEMDMLLKDIQIDIIDVNFYSVNIKQIASLIDLKKGSISYDFLGDSLFNSQPINLDDLAELTASNEDINTITVNGEGYHTAKTTIAQELAFTLAHGVEYLNKLTDKGLTANKIANSMQFTFATGTNYFFEIAKIRAARILWQSILNEFKVENVPMNIHTVTSSVDFTEDNVANNILRNTTKAMSAIIGGCDSLTILAHDNNKEKADFANRIARNVQHLLKEESFFDKVNNPADGSYYIENITHEIVNKAWGIFQEIEAKGGYLAALKSNFILS